MDIVQISNLARHELDFLLWIQNNIRHGLLDWLRIITHFADAGIGFIILALLLIAIRKTRRNGIYTAAALIVGVILVNMIIKPLAHRTRPYLLEEAIDLLVKRETDFSFPSGHTNAAFCFAWALWRSLPRGRKLWGGISIGFAALIGLSRLYVGVHYPTDVIVGVMTGILSAEIARFIVRKIRRRIPKATRKKYRI